MPKLKQLSGKDIIKILDRFGFIIHSQRGSHIKLRRVILERKEVTIQVMGLTWCQLCAEVAKSCS
jgi:predicted RNA binding protein YcfA (HicA-like mRNA interferase family)